MSVRLPLGPGFAALPTAINTTVEPTAVKITPVRPPPGFSATEPTTKVSTAAGITMPFIPPPGFATKATTVSATGDTATEATADMYATSEVSDYFFEMVHNQLRPQIRALVAENTELKLLLKEQNKQVNALTSQLQSIDQMVLAQVKAIAEMQLSNNAQKEANAKCQMYWEKQTRLLYQMKSDQDEEMFKLRILLKQQIRQKEQDARETNQYGNTGCCGCRAQKKKAMKTTNKSKTCCSCFSFLWNFAWR